MFPNVAIKTAPLFFWRRGKSDQISSEHPWNIPWAASSSLQGNLLYAWADTFSLLSNSVVIYFVWQGVAIARKPNQSSWLRQQHLRMTERLVTLHVDLALTLTIFTAQGIQFGEAVCLGIHGITTNFRPVWFLCKVSFGPSLNLAVCHWQVFQPARIQMWLYGHGRDFSGYSGILGLRFFSGSNKMVLRCIFNVVLHLSGFKL